MTVDDIKSLEKSSCVAGPFGSNISSKYFVESGVPIIRGGNLRNDLTRFVPEGFAFVSEEQAKKYKAQHVRAGDLVFTCWGTVGQVGLVPEDGPYAEYIISNKQLKLRPNLEITDPEYLFFYFAGPKMVQHVLGKAIGAAVPGINLGILKELPVVLPPLPVQRRIANILSAYDQLIENSQRRIKILESMARALYREWFVHFRFPGHESVPRVSSPLGEIPVGWEVRKLGEVAEEMRRNVPKGSLEDPAPFVGLEHIPRRSLALDAWENTTELGSNKLEFKKGEVLFGKIRPYFHKVSVAPFDGLCSADTIVIRSRRPEHYAMVVGCVSSDDFVALATATSNGSKMPRASWSVLAEHQIAIPPSTVARQFSAVIEPAIAQMQALVFQIQNLRRTRDLLLPRLLSGQIDVEALAS
jgi:type I restriction enzyme S subunit